MSETVQYPSTTTIVTDTISTGNVSVTLDTLKQWPYLLASATNSAAIIAGMTRLANTYLNAQGGAFWSNALIYSTVTVSPGTVAGGNSFTGGRVIPDGRVIMSPWNSPGIGIWNPKTSTFTTVVSGWTNPGMQGAVLLQDGRVLFCPNGSYLGLFNPTTGACTSVLTSAWPSGTVGGVQVPDGRVIFTPATNVNIGVYNPYTNIVSSIAISPTGGTNYAYGSSVLLPNGNVVFTPLNNNFIGIFNPTTNGFSTCSTPFAINSGLYYTGCLIPDGRVVFTPTGTNVYLGIYNPATNSFTTVTLPYSGYRTGCSLPDGRVVLAPAGSGNIGIYNSVTNSFTTVSGATGATYIGTELMSNGTVVFIPFTTGSTPPLGFLPVFNQGVPPEFTTSPMFNNY